MGRSNTNTTTWLLHSFIAYFSPCKFFWLSNIYASQIIAHLRVGSSLKTNSFLCLHHHLLAPLTWVHSSMSFSTNVVKIVSLLVYSHESASLEGQPMWLGWWSGSEQIGVRHRMAQWWIVIRAWPFLIKLGGTWIAPVKAQCQNLRPKRWYLFYKSEKSPKWKIPNRKKKENQLVITHARHNVAVFIVLLSSLVAVSCAHCHSSIAPLYPPWCSPFFNTHAPLKSIPTQQVPIDI